MADVDKIAKEVRLKFERPRRLELPEKGSPPPQELSEGATTAREMGDNFKKVADKARTILDASSKIAEVRRVPVPEDAIELRAAVVRQDPDSQGLFITYQLYRRSLAYLRQERNVFTPELLDVFTGDPVLDQRRAQEVILETVENLDRDTARMIASQVTVLYISKLLQMGLDNLDSGKQTATKQPSGTEAVVIAVQVALSIAAQLVYAGLTEQEIEASFESLGGSMPQGLDVEGAKKQLAETPMFKAAITGKRSSDYRLIVDFVRVYINQQTGPGWESWQLADDLEEIAMTAEVSAQTISTYHGTEIDQEVEVDLQIAAESAISAGLNQFNLPDFPQYMRDLYGRTLNQLNAAVDKMAHVLSNVISPDDLCCILNWLERMDSEALKKSKEWLEVSHNALQRLDRNLDKVQFGGQLSMSVQMHQSIMTLLQGVMDNSAALFKQWLGDQEESWKELFQCRLIDEYIEYCVRGIEYLGNLLVSYVDRYLGFMEEQDLKVNNRASFVADLKEIRNLITVADAFIELSQQALGSCGDDDPTRLAVAVEQVQNRLGPSTAIPITGDDPYATVQSPPFETNTGVTIPAVPGASAGITPMEAAVEVCRDGLVRNNFVPFPRGTRTDRRQ